MNLLPLADLLETAGLGTKGGTLFIDMLPAEATQAILLRNPLSGTPIDHELPGYYQSHLQMIVRTPAGKYADAEALIAAATAALTVSEQRIGSMFFNYMRPKTLPVVYPLSKGNLLEFSVQLDYSFSMEV